MGTPSRLKRGLGAAAIAFAILGLALGWLWLAPRHVPEGQPPLATLDADALAAFRQAFDDAGGVRLVLLLSPT